MDKQSFIKNLSRYYLGGKCKDVRWDIVDGSLFVDFLTDDGAMLGTLSAVVEMPNTTFPIFNTDKFIAMTNVLGDDISVKFVDGRDEPVGIELADSDAVVYYKSGKLSRIPDPNGRLEKFRNRGRALSSEPNCVYTIQLDKSFVSKLLKSKKALSEAEIVAISLSGSTAEFIVNYSENNENKITIPFGAVISGPDNMFIYNVELLCLVLSINDDYRTASVKISDNGLIVMEFAAEDYQVTYYLRALNAA